MDTESSSNANKKTAVAATDWLLSNFAQFEKGLNGGAKLPLHAKRKAALANYQRLGFPNSSQEDWKYTNPAVIQEKSFPLFSNAKTNPAISTDKDSCFTSGLLSIRIEIINGQVQTCKNCPAGLIIQSLKEIQQSSGEMAVLVEKQLASHAEKGEAFVAMNTALMENAVVIHLAQGVKLDSPVELLFYTDNQASETTILPRLLVVADKDSQAIFIERYLSESAIPYCVNSVAEFAIAENADIQHYRLQAESTEAFHVSTIAASLESFAHFNTQTFSFGGKLVRNHVNITMLGKNCNVVMNGLTAITGSQHVDNHTLLDNTKPNCESNELYKGVYADSSQGVFSGSIIVRQDAQKTNAIQSNRSLLLSDKAGVNTKPQLKIWADDVKCTHGATIGQLDEDAMFYIRSRGVSEKEAKVMLVHAFASEVIAGVKVTALRDNLEELLLDKLNLGASVV